MHTPRVHSVWPLVATLGTHCGAPFNVLCAWLARDGSYAWLFDEEGWLRRVDLRTSDARSWRIVDDSANSEPYECAAQFAAAPGSEVPFLWVSYRERASESDDRDDPCTVSVYALDERGPQLRRAMPFDRRAYAGPDGVGAECGAVIVRETSYPERAHVFMPDGTPLGRREPSVIAATSRGCWEKQGDRFELTSHDGVYIGGTAVAYADDWLALGPVGEARFALESAGDLAIVHAEGARREDAKSGLDFEGRSYEFAGGSRRPPYVLHSSCAIASPRPMHRGAPRAAYATQAWSSPETTSIAFGENAILQWLDERWALATTRGHCALFDRASGEITQSHCPPVRAIALGDASQAMVVQHEGGLTRWWDVGAQRIIAEDRSTLGTERELLGLRCGSTRALFIEEPTFGEVMLIERALVDGAAREVWSVAVAKEHFETPSVVAMGEDHVMVYFSRWTPALCRAALVSRDATTPIALGEREYIHGRLVSDDGELVLERQIATGPGAPTSILQRERIHADGTRSVIDARLLSVNAGAVATRAGWVGRGEQLGRVRLLERSGDGAAVEHEWNVASQLQSCAQDVQRVAALTQDSDEVCVVDAARGVFAQWTAIERDDEITALAISDDGSTVAVGTASGRALVFREPAER